MPKYLRFLIYRGILALLRMLRFRRRAVRDGCWVIEPSSIAVRLPQNMLCGAYFYPVANTPIDIQHDGDHRLGNRDRFADRRGFLLSLRRISSGRPTGSLEQIILESKYRVYDQTMGNRVRTQILLTAEQRRHLRAWPKLEKKTASALIRTDGTLLWFSTLRKKGGYPSANQAPTARPRRRGRPRACPSQGRFGPPIRGHRRGVPLRK